MSVAFCNKESTKRVAEAGFGRNETLSCVMNPILNQYSSTFIMTGLYMLMCL